MAQLRRAFTVDDPFSAIAGWGAASGGGSIAAGVNPFNGDACINLTAAGSLSQSDKTVTINQADTGSIMLDVHATPSGTLATTAGTFQMFLGLSAFAGYLNTQGIPLFPGMNRLILSRRTRVVSGVSHTGFTYDGASPVSAATTYAIIRAIGAANCSYRFSKLRSGGWARSSIYVRIDDGLDSVYNYMFPKFQSRGIAGTLAIIPSKIGTAGYMTWAQVTEMWLAGWDVVNHTLDHVLNDLSSGSLATIRTQIGDAKSDLEDRGFTRNNENLLFINPFGQSSTTCNQVLAENGIIQAFSTIPRGGSLWYENPYYYPSYNADSFDGGGSYSSAWYAKWIAQLTYAVQSGTNVVALLHGCASGTPSSATIMTEAEFDAFLGWLTTMKACAYIGEGLTSLVRDITRNGPNPA